MIACDIVQAILELFTLNSITFCSRIARAALAAVCGVTQVHKQWIFSTIYDFGIFRSPMIRWPCHLNELVQRVPLIPLSLIGVSGEEAENWYTARPWVTLFFGFWKKLCMSKTVYHEVGNEKIFVISVILAILEQTGLKLASQLQLTDLRIRLHTY